MNKYWLNITNTILILVVVGFSLWLINKNFPPSNVLIIEAKLGQDLAMISRLGPEPRVKLEKDYQTVLETPIYFNLRTMPWYQQAEIYIIYEEFGQELVGLGGQIGPGFNYNLMKPVVIMDLTVGGANLKKAVFKFDLSNIYQQKNLSRFLISTQPVNKYNRGEFHIKTLKVILTR